MKNLLITLFILFTTYFSYSQKIMSWNIQNLGEVKFKRDTIIPKLAHVMMSLDPDIIAIQEVVTGRYGDSCIIQLSKLLNFIYVISKRTTGNGSERYAFLYKKTIKLKWSKLDKSLEDSMDREPFMACFVVDKKTIIIRQVHLVPISKNPQREVAMLKYTDGIICGDFNLTCDHLVFNNLRENFQSPLCGKGTSLKRNGTVSDNNYDHFFIDKKFTIKFSFVYFYSFEWNRNILSDHLPIFIEF
jgi:endonuclease/exonuclease/phosphatase family metal-dependent hydrolase